MWLDSHCFDSPRHVIRNVVFISSVNETIRWDVRNYLLRFKSWLLSMWSKLEDILIIVDIFLRWDKSLVSPLGLSYRSFSCVLYLVRSTSSSNDKDRHVWFETYIYFDLFDYLGLDISDTYWYIISIWSEKACFSRIELKLLINKVNQWVLCSLMTLQKLIDNFIFNIYNHVFLHQVHLREHT